MESMGSLALVSKECAAAADVLRAGHDCVQHFRSIPAAWALPLDMHARERGGGLYEEARIVRHVEPRGGRRCPVGAKTAGTGRLLAAAGQFCI
jgi:hypothetical protein